MSVPSASFGWSCTVKDIGTVRGTVHRVLLELSANRRQVVALTVEGESVTTVFMSRTQASALGAAIQLALLAVPETEDDINEIHDQGDQG